MTTRTCNRCGVERDLVTEFPRNKHCRGGHIWTCKGCIHEQRSGKPGYYRTLVCTACGVEFQRRGRTGSWQYCADCNSKGKVCKRCKQFKPRDQFIGTGDGARNCAGPCYEMAWRERRYKLPEGTAEAIFSAFKEECAICGATESRGPQKSLVVDHCHVTGKIRGFLCRHCNLAIGMLKDDPVLVAAALSYLEQHPVPKAA